ncbi:hypothetical protein PH586_20350 [Pseudomonas sp. SA3-5]|uniref:Uncharacterized protein n=1 Tax=Pseudomonas aestuarii TaxID=3018340 RepID=A0ABT4XKH8_9PSED|nr:hypothetical protein [Pseudomonas aestuarii]MDA7088735.1 hypothetical protein [Pseudomonas aestuarii]
MCQDVDNVGAELSFSFFKLAMVAAFGFDICASDRIFVVFYIARLASELRRINWCTAVGIGIKKTDDCPFLAGVRLS